MKAFSAVRILVAYAVLFVYVCLLFVFSTLTFRVGIRHYFHRFARLFGWTYLTIVGVRVKSPSQSILNQRRGRIITINHSSQLDFFLGAVMMPPWGTVVAKQEVLTIPVLGWALALLGLVTIDRSNNEKARKTIAEAGERIRNEDASIIIAPEGTRSATGAIGPFKMGAFHMAKSIGVPICLVAFRTPQALQPLGSKTIRPGTIVVEVLDTIEPSQFEALSPHELRDRVRDAYLDALQQTE